MAAKEQDVAQTSPPGRALGDLAKRVVAIVERASDLRVAYEEDVNVVTLGDLAGDLRRLSGCLENALYAIDTALNEL